MLTVTQKARIEKGARLLDVENPGWFNYINLTSLEISSFKTCVLGQLYSSYFDGVRKLFPKHDLLSIDKEAAEYGFYPSDEEAWAQIEKGETSSAERTDYWREVIQRRKAESI